MDPMWGTGIILGTITVAIPSALLTIAVAYCLYRAAGDFLRWQAVQGLAFLLVGTALFLLFPVSILWADHADRERAAAIANLHKTGSLRNYPDVLVVRGHISGATAAKLMLVAGFEAIDVSERSRGTTLNISSASGCRSALSEWRARGAEPFAPIIKRCISETKWGHSGEPQRSNAVVLLKDRHSTLRPKGGGWASGNLELRLKRDGEETLVDYWEAPYSTRPIFPLLVGWHGYLKKAVPKVKTPGSAEFVLRNLQT